MGHEPLKTNQVSHVFDFVRYQKDAEQGLIQGSAA